MMGEPSRVTRHRDFGHVAILAIPDDVEDRLPCSRAPDTFQGRRRADTPIAHRSLQAKESLVTTGHTPLRLHSPSLGTQLALQPDDPPVLIGRQADSGLASNHPLVSTQHARVLHRDGAWFFEDLGSAGGSFVNGQPVSSHRIDGTCEVVLGDPSNGEVLRLELEQPEAAWTATSPGRVKAATAEAQADGDAVFAAQMLTVETSGVRRLDTVTFALPRGAMLGVLGGSGAGKSTLVKAITGSGPATSGRVLFDGYDLYENYDLLRRRLGYVPQDDILHASLTVAETLHFSARLRMPDASQTERASRSAQVLEELGIGHRADARVSELSGGQRKRLNVAVELLSRPPLLLLDEPTSGLDPANERSMMRLLRQLADGGRTIIVVTHNTESLHLVDDVLVLARGGVPVFLGPADEFAERFEQPSLIDAFAFVDSHADPKSLRGFVDQEQKGALELQPSATAPLEDDEGWTAELSEASADVGRDAWTLLQRSVYILRGDRRNAAILAVQAPLIALMLVLLFHGKTLEYSEFDPSQNKNGPSLLLAMVLGVIFIGAASTVREIVKERTLMLREQAVGVPTASYFASKTLLWSVVIVVQSALIVLVVTMFNSGPNSGLLRLGPVNETMWVVMLSGLVAVVSGLCISALVTSTDKAMTLLPIFLFVQLLFAGLVVPVHQMPVRLLSWFVSAKWGLDGVGAVADLWGMRAVECFEPGECSANWQHRSTNLVLSLLVLTVFLLGLGFLTYRALRRSDPSRMLVARGGSR